MPDGCVYSKRVFTPRQDQETASSSLAASPSWISGGVSIERVEVPRAAVRPFDSERLHEKLEFLVNSMVRDRARSLLALQSAFWSFVDAQDVGSGPRSA